MKIPFVGLHAHSVAGSPFDGLGYPGEHMDFAYENGMDALALTDHGNCNGLAYQVLHAKKMKAEGKDFKPIFGVEAYFHPNLEQWSRDYEEAQENKKQAQKIKKQGSAGTVVEDEDRSAKDKIKKRSHLILLAQNQTGLENIFKLISESYEGDNFYRFPRMDYAMLKEHSEGIIAMSACLGGVYAGNMWDNREDGSEAILEAMRETTRQMIEVFGDRWYGELQWNAVPEQHELNKYVIQMHQEFGIPLVSTADSHYPSQTAWKDRLLYKKLGWLGKNLEMATDLPVDVDEVGYELYPKNGEEMWKAYKHYSEGAGVEYDDDLIRQSLVETHTIAHERIDSFLPDNEVRLPDFVVPPGKTATQALTAMCLDGMREKLPTKMEDDEYIQRLRSELQVIDDRGFSKYFLTMKAIADKATEIQLAGPGRGSAAGSLVAYVLGITQVDPIKYGLLFSRFLRADAKDYPDIDYDVSDPMVLKEILSQEWGESPWCRSLTGTLSSCGR